MGALNEDALVVHVRTICRLVRGPGRSAVRVGQVTQNGVHPSANLSLVSSPRGYLGTSSVPAKMYSQHPSAGGELPRSPLKKEGVH